MVLVSLRVNQNQKEGGRSGHPLLVFVRGCESMCSWFRVAGFQLSEQGTENQKPSTTSQKPDLAGETGDLLAILRREIDKIHAKTYSELMMLNHTCRGYLMSVR